MNKGVIYLATGKKFYLEECIFSATSLKKHCPDIPITLFTDNPDINEECFDEVIVTKNDTHPFKKKVECLPMSPYEYTLYLDGDTQVVQPIYEMFEWLSEYDLGVANSPEMDHTKKPSRLISYVKPDNYNAGVILYRKSKKTKRFFEHWLRVMTPNGETGPRSYHDNDQRNFNDLIREKYHIECGIKLKVFSNKMYNARPLIVKQLKKDKEINSVKIIHSHCLHMNPLELFIWKLQKKLKNQKRMAFIHQRG